MKNISHILQFIDSARFMASSLSNLANDLSKGIQRIKRKLGNDDEKCKTCCIKYKNCNCFLECTNFKDDLIKYRSSGCNKSSQRKFDKKLKERIFNTYKFSNHYNNEFILFFQKGVYPYEYINDWAKLNEVSLPEKEDFYSHLNMEDITDPGYAYAKRVREDFEINLGEYHDLDIQRDTLLLADVFENFKNMFLKIYELDPAKVLWAPRLALQAAWKWTKVKLDLLISIDMLLMVEKGIRGGICSSVYRCAKANNTWKIIKKNKESSYLQYWDVINLYGWAMSQKLPVNNFEWTKESSQFNEDFIKNYNEESNEGYFLEIDVQWNWKLNLTRFKWNSTGNENNSFS